MINLLCRSLRPRPLFVLVALLLLPQVAGAIDLLVYNNNNSGPGSLRQVIGDNNAIGGGNRIVFSNTVTGTITLTTGEIVISTNVTILGPGPNVLMVSGNNSNRIFNISGGTVSISGLTIANGFAPRGGGGGALALSTVNFSNCVFNANATGGNGGAVSSSGNLLVNQCAFFGNGSTGSGAALFLSGSANLNNTTIFGNFTDISGDGGGIENFFCDLTLSGCTIVGNFGYQGGGVRGGTNTVVRNTIIAGNSAASADGSQDVLGVFISGGYNLVGITNASRGWGEAPARRR
jgi:hypothetical protein